MQVLVIFQIECSLWLASGLKNLYIQKRSGILSMFLELNLHLNVSENVSWIILKTSFYAQSLFSNKYGITTGLHFLKFIFVIYTFNTLKTPCIHPFTDPFIHSSILLFIYRMFYWVPTKCRHWAMYEKYDDTWNRNGSCFHADCILLFFQDVQLQKCRKF